MERTEIIERINILQKYTLDILEEYFQLQKASSTEKIALSPSMLLIQAAIEQSQPQRSQGFWKTFFESRTEESVKRAIAVDVYQKYQALLKTVQQELPTEAFENILSRQVGKIAIERFGIKLIIYSLSKKEPLRWKTA